MKRSEVNNIMKEADAFMKSHGFFLPPFAYWTPDEWRAKGPEVREIVQNQMGWDITDFGQGNYEQFGLFLFTLRNGSVANLRSGRGKTYAEKVLIVDVDQITPMHFHWDKTEDIINRGGGRLAIQLYNSNEDDELADTDITVSMDGVVHTFKAGETVILDVGESITLPTGLYHKFWGVESQVLVGEVSKVNDDANDNRFLEPIGRFPEIEEDEPPLHLLMGDYEAYYAGGQ
ncbi:MAG: D-lyxose/D-mannose family sugar isomerase [Anaerolineae bacterium]|nr:D-lyxose/D-mannose family sugar isomerase [Anaerolineae bacterium]MCB9106984.1 D-lyxose/D-mannose family sugar isomerase [Anaerolineales bacterium]